MASTLKITVPEPCSQKWTDMDLTQSGRYCGHCEKEVIDFTKMSPHQLTDWFSNSTGRVCGRITSRQLAALDSQPEYKNNLGGIAAKIAVAACLTLVTHLKTSAANALAPKYPIDFYESKIGKNAFNDKNGPNLDSLITIKGIVKDKDDGLPVPGAVIKIKDTNISTISDEKGQFTIRVPNETKKVILVLNYIGYNTIEQEINLTKPNIEVAMEAEQTILGAIVVVKRSPNLFLNLYYKLKEWIR